MVTPDEARFSRLSTTSFADKGKGKSRPSYAKAKGKRIGRPSSELIHC